MRRPCSPRSMRTPTLTCWACMAGPPRWGGWTSCSPSVCPPIAIVNVTHEYAQALAGNPDLIVEADQPLVYPTSELAAAHDPASAVPTLESAQLTVRVCGSDGTDLPKAHVWVIGTAMPIHTVTKDDAGRLCFCPATPPPLFVPFMSAPPPDIGRPDWTTPIFPTTVKRSWSKSSRCPTPSLASPTLGFHVGSTRHAPPRTTSWLPWAGRHRRHPRRGHQYRPPRSKESHLRGPGLQPRQQIRLGR